MEKILLPDLALWIRAASSFDCLPNSLVSDFKNKKGELFDII